MRFIKFIAALVLVSLSLFSCKDHEDHVREAVNGMWSVESISYKGKDIRNCVMANVISFSEGEYCDFPLIDDDCLKANGVKLRNSEIGRGRWEVELSDTAPLFLSFQGYNPLYTGKHRLIFLPGGHPGNFTMEIVSDSLQIRASKQLLWLAPIKPAVRKFLVDISNR